MDVLSDLPGSSHPMLRLLSLPSLSTCSLFVPSSDDGSLERESDGEFTIMIRAFSLRGGNTP
ncbi:hypothetical protein M378DRAFT_158201, partial [Amanita muscaria Koide BX008]